MKRPRHGWRAKRRRERLLHRLGIYETFRTMQPAKWKGWANSVGSPPTTDDLIEAMRKSLIKFREFKPPIGMEIK